MIIIKVKGKKSMQFPAASRKAWLWKLQRKKKAKEERMGVRCNLMAAQTEF